MDNQHKKIKQYRDLTQQEIAAMNSLKSAEADMAALLGHVSADIPEADKRDLALARTHFEEAFIRAVRAVARPVSPWNR